MMNPRAQPLPGLILFAALALSAHAAPGEALDTARTLTRPTAGEKSPNDEPLKGYSISLARPGE